MEKIQKQVSKSLVFLKASVIAMGIVFVVLLAALIILKSKKPTQKVSNCESFLKVQVTEEIEDMEIQNNQIIVLTKFNSKTKKQEIIKFDSSCLKITNRIELNVF